MGMESYTVDFIFESAVLEKEYCEGYEFHRTGHSGISEEFFEEKITEAPYNIYKTRTYDEKSYVYNGEMEFQVERSDSSDIMSVQFRGCLAWYEPSIKRIFEMAKYINDNIGTGYLLAYSNPIGFDDYNLFKKDIIENIEDRYKIFVGQYGIINHPVIASEFYVFIKKRKRIFFKWKSKFKYEE